MIYLPNVFRIVSWNMQGAGGTEKTTGLVKDKLSLLQEYMLDEQVIAICLQECSDLFGWAQRDKGLAELLPKEVIDRQISKRNEKQKQLSARYAERNRTEDSLKPDDQWAEPIWYNRGRLSLGILIRKRYFTGQKITLLDLNRPIMGVKLHGFNSREPFYLLSIHVPYSNRDPVYIKDTLEYVSDKLARIEGKEASWMCAGDFNFSPVQEKGLECFAPNIRRPGILTTKRHEYDYCYVGGRALSSLGSSVHVQHSLHSDHHPVHFLFSPWPQIPKHASDLASKLASQSVNTASKLVWQLYHRAFPTGKLHQKAV